jgi:hypothetical protein
VFKLDERIVPEKRSEGRRKRKTDEDDLIDDTVCVSVWVAPCVCGGGGGGGGGEKKKKK